MARVLARKCRMTCYCGQSQPGVWDERGIVHNGSGCRYTDLLITVHGTYRHAELEGAE